MQLVEQAQALRVHRLVQNDRVIEPSRCEVAVQRRLEAQTNELRLAGGEQIEALRRRDSPRVGGLQLVHEASQEVGEGHGVTPLRRQAFARLRVAARREVLRGAARADKGRERLIELGAPRQVRRVVQELMDDRLGQILGLVAQQRRQQRIGKPAEGAERQRRADVGVEALVLQGARFGQSILLRKEALVGNPADDGEPPGVGAQFEARRRGDDVDHLVVIDLGERRVAVAGA